MSRDMSDFHDILSDIRLAVESREEVIDLTKSVAGELGDMAKAADRMKRGEKSAGAIDLVTHSRRAIELILFDTARIIGQAGFPDAPKKIVAAKDPVKAAFDSALEGLKAANLMDRRQAAGTRARVPTRTSWHARSPRNKPSTSAMGYSDLENFGFGRSSSSGDIDVADLIGKPIGKLSKSRETLSGKDTSS